MGRGAELGGVELGGNQLDAIAVTAEVGCVEREESVLAMGEHGGYDVGVVDLASRHGIHKH